MHGEMESYYLSNFHTFLGNCAPNTLLIGVCTNDASLHVVVVQFNQATEY